jgi:hypothetical protein
MCVIMIAGKVRPTEEMVRRAWDSNKDGFGIAYWDKGEVVWEKGVMEVEKAVELCEKTPLPYVAHWRVASIGGVKPSLTHPFEVSAKVNLALKGRTKVGVLFHNGHWAPWNEKVLDAAIYSNTKLPSGSDWSDSRGMAFLVHIYGPEVMNLLTTQKGVFVTPKMFDIFTGPGWEKINEVWCSNDYFWLGRRSTHTTYHGRICSVGRCREKAQTGKDICSGCEAERKSKAATIANETSGVGQSQPTAQTQATAVAVATGGSAGPLVKTLSMSEVEAFYRGGIISKNTLKKYRKAYADNQDRHPKRQQRALLQMRDLSEEIAERLIQGAGPVN